jgi:putative tryptophan/tyrosine transport system substrate-binding protein
MRRREFIAGLGGAAVWPLVARAQQQTKPTIGILDFFGRQPKSPAIEAFRAGLADSGFIDGTNLSIDYLSAGGDSRLLPSLAADLVGRQVAVIVAVGALEPALRAKAATSTIPIVFHYFGDPVQDGLVASLSRPGGNVTGITSNAGESGGLDGKRLELLLQLVPQVRKVAFLSGDRSFIFYEQYTTSMLAAGRALGVEIMIVECRSDRDYEAALAMMVEGRADAMILGNFALSNREKIVSLAALHKLPAIYPFRQLVRLGGLISYGDDILDLYRRVGGAYVARILKGAKPADLPVELPQKFEMAINPNTANALGLNLPPTLLALADEVIE